jgi:hypothetical protein
MLQLTKKMSQFVLVGMVTLMLGGCFALGSPPKKEPSPIGTEWLSVNLDNGEAAWEFASVDGIRVFTETSGSETVLYSVEELNGEFEICGRLYQTAENQWSGIVFNFADKNQFYALRVRSGKKRQVQLLARVGSDWVVMDSAEGLSIMPNMWIHLSVRRGSEKITYSVGSGEAGHSGEVVLSEEDPGHNNYGGSHFGYLSVASTYESPVYFSTLDIEETVK